MDWVSTRKRLWEFLRAKLRPRAQCGMPVCLQAEFHPIVPTLHAFVNCPGAHFVLQ